MSRSKLIQTLRQKSTQPLIFKSNFLSFTNSYYQYHPTKMHVCNILCHTYFATTPTPLQEFKLFKLWTTNPKLSSAVSSCLENRLIHLRILLLCPLLTNFRLSTEIYSYIRKQQTFLLSHFFKWLQHKQES